MESANLHFVKMACEAVLLAFTLVLGLSAGRCVTVAVVYQSPEHGFCHNLRPNAIVQDDNTHPHRVKIIREYLTKQMGVVSL